jgi:acetyl esterase/lipase
MTSASITRRKAGLWAATSLSALGLPLPGHAQAGPPLPAAAFFERPAFGDAQFSPSGRRVAFRVGAASTRDRLGVLDIETMKVQLAASFDDVDVIRFAWVNDQRLLFNTGDRRLAQADQRFASGLFAVNADGGGFRQLVQREHVWVRDGIGTSQLPWNTFALWQMGAQDGDEVFVVQPEQITDKGVGYIRLLRLNTVNGRSTDVATPEHATHWLIDGQGALRAVLSEKDARATLYWQQGGQWKVLRQFDRFTGGDLQPAFVGPDGQVLALARPGRDTVAVYSYDPATDKLGDKPVIGTPQFDLAPRFIATDRKLLGLRFTVDAEVTHWLDDEMKAHQAEVDKLLPATANMLDLPRRGDSPHLLVRAFADVQPELFFLYDRRSKKLARLGAAQPAIRAGQMASMDLVRYKARDGLEIPAYLTLPPGGARKNLPLVVWVHGGPWGRGTSWGWRAEIQFLASRGFAVLQPEFRGSTGFGDRHFRASFKQWGLAMQDDLADGARWAIEQGIADAKRIAIMGASYGGYAALMGLARDGDLFRCGISHVGVSDILLMYDAHWSDLNDEWKRYGMPQMVGDREKDRAQLEATSPIRLADRIRNPLLIAHGAVDRRVPVEHGERIYKAVKAHNPNVEWVLYDKEGHGFSLPENEADFMQRVERFLARHLG